MPSIQNKNLGNCYFKNIQNVLWYKCIQFKIKKIGVEVIN